MKITFTILFFAALLSMGADNNELFAQTQTSIQGKVTNSEGEPVEGAAVILYSRSNQIRSTTVTNPQGEYRFQRILAGDYIIEVSANGFETTSQSAHVEKDSSANADLVLTVHGPKENIQVTASGTPQTVDEVSKATSTVTAEEMEQRNELSIVESLRTVPGLRIQQLGSPGSFARIQTRGLRDSDTAILIDGFRFRDAASTQGDATAFLEELFVVNTDRIEIVRGSGSSLYGTNAIGGVINILSDQGGGPAHGQILAEGGDLGIFRSRAQFSGGLDDNRLIYSGGFAALKIDGGVDGDISTDNYSGQAFVQYNFSSNISLSGRLFGNDAYLQQTDSPFAAPGVVLPPRGSEVDAVPLPLDQQRRFEAGEPIVLGDANFIPNLRDPDNQRDSSFIAAAFSFHQRVNDAFGYQAFYQRINTNRRFSDGPEGARFEPLFPNSSDFNGRLDTFGFKADLQLGEHNLLTAGYEFEREKYINSSRDENPDIPARLNSGAEIKQTSSAFFLQDQFEALDKRFQALLAFRVQSFNLSDPVFFGGSSIYEGQDFESPKTAYTGDASFSYFFHDAGTKLRSHVGNGYRAPSAFERLGTSFSNGVFSPFGDPRLQPERSIAADVGIDQFLSEDRIQFSATYFYTRLQEVIVFDSSGAIDPTTDPFGRSIGYRNTGGGLARGVELAANIKPFKSLVLGTSYTFTNAEARFATAVPGFLRTFVQPRHIFTLYATQEVTKNLDVIFDLFAYSSYFFPFSGRAYRFDGPVKADLGAVYTLSFHDNFSLRVYGKVENIFDNHYYESGFRIPGTTFIAGASIPF
ncbi:TonB-dependent receptor [bacterium]|nr:TonB-dependent receptor [bacterium]MCI0602265.1 TonB-dependent receptor [bacterium]